MLIGCTMEEAMTRVSASEVSVRMQYRAKYGALNPHRMYDLGSGVVASALANSKGGKSSPSDFMPYYKKPEEQEVSGEELFDMIASHSSVKRGR